MKKKSNLARLEILVPTQTKKNLKKVSKNSGVSVSRIISDFINKLL